MPQGIVDPEAVAAEILLILEKEIDMGAISPREGMQRALELGRLRGRHEGVELAKEMLHGLQK